MEERQRCLKELAVFSRLNWDEVKLICEKAYEKKYLKDEVIFFERNDDDKLYILVAGRVKLSLLSPDGKEKSLTILQEGDIFGEISLFAQDAHPMTAEVIEDARLVIISLADLESIIMKNPGVAIKIIEALAKKSRLLTSQIRELVFQDAEGRLASLLLRFADEFGVRVKSGQMIDIVLTHQEIANLLGASRVTVTKLLNRLTDEGIIKKYKRKIVIIKRSKLEEKIEIYK
ncbi:cyclic nucleotide-binding domain-containing protein [Iocasia frigidifontis]|uniref:Cyclic nucleotide-binding domain-containing protein n=1 Tax=Iocasia fonsfrigidae TaxID=2682810 RepID=A0A8A7KI79_9FIRM|nr:MULTISPECIES: Crp/Fnr family transcriptional regulator [Halanaerobiaceae]AZO95696.1 Crp/Fnr family transcriptional regulator [Halocella sp. SP3-1]MTI60889.1 Crp/Fnr family transcriptional regulator [Bacillota bacterium]QTL98557.1 cyclic nucleotide-binding domain-containing protein [Iocasia fonsfrigidae]